MKQISVYITLLLTFFTLSSCEQTHTRLTDYSYTRPAQQHDGIQTGDMFNMGMDTARIVNLTRLILADTFPNIHSLLIMKDDKLLYENYFAGKDEIVGSRKGYIEHTLDDLHDCRSISKTFTAACVGIAVKKRTY